MFSNELKFLESENKKQYNNLDNEDKVIIDNILKSMSIFRVNSYDSQVILRDIIGMAQELKLRNSSITESSGNDIKKFIDEIINNSAGVSKIEIVLNFLSKLSGYFFIWFSFLAFSAFGTFDMNISLSLIIFYVCSVIAIFIVEGLLVPKFINKKGYKKYIPNYISLLIFIMLSCTAYSVKDFIVFNSVNSIYIIILSGIIYIFNKYLITLNIHRLAKGKHHHIKDLI